MTTYRTTCWGETHEVSADWAQASSSVDGCDGRQVADFQHCPERAMRWALMREANAGGFHPEAPEDDDDREALAEIVAAVEAMEEVDEDEETEEED